MPGGHSERVVFLEALGLVSQRGDESRKSVALGFKAAADG
jgi:hypothetical protein